MASSNARASAVAHAGVIYAIERIGQLTELARQRFANLGYANIELRTGDGTGGWPDAAPFDAILAAAGGPSVPEMLRRQLAIGGRLVMPVGETQQRQRLVKVVRVAEDRFEAEHLDDVMFVPLIGEHGWKSGVGGAVSPPHTGRPL